MRTLSSADSTQELIKYKEEIMESVLSLVKKYLEEQAVKSKPAATYLDQPTPPGVIQRHSAPRAPIGTGRGYGRGWSQPIQRFTGPKPTVMEAPKPVSNKKMEMQEREYEEEQQCYSTMACYDPAEQEDIESQVMDKLCLMKQTEQPLLTTITCGDHQIMIPLVPELKNTVIHLCLLYTSPSPRD